MTKDMLMARIAAIVTTLADMGGSPESTLYLALGMDMDAWQTIRGIMLRSGLVNISSHYVTLTDSGKVTADRLNAVIEERR